MRQTATYALPSPWPLQLLLWIAAFALAFCIHTTTADAGNTRRTMRLTVYRPARIQGRIATGRPFLKTTEYLAGTGYYGAKTIYSNSPGGLLGTILTPRWFIR
jgi:hypothetical protein